MNTQFKEIPEAYKITSLLHQKTYLVGGELKEWKGEFADVYSTISSTKDYKPTLLGTVPNLGENEALEALNSAYRASFSPKLGTVPNKL